MSAIENVLKLATQEIGTKECPANSNKVKYNTWYYGKEVCGPSYPWCMVFVQWCFNKANIQLPIRTASCSELKNAAIKSNMWITNNYKQGDIIIFDFTGKKTATSHTGICESVCGNNITTIDGNTGTTNEANGGAVMRRTRNIKYVTGAIRPNYATNKSSNVTKNTTSLTFSAINGYLPTLKKGDNNEYVSILQILLNIVKGCKLEVDGSFGPATYAEVSKLSSTGNVTAAVWKELLKK